VGAAVVAGFRVVTSMFRRSPSEGGRSRGRRF
jgi:hypothetical protein